MALDIEPVLASAGHRAMRNSGIAAALWIRVGHAPFFVRMAMPALTLPATAPVMPAMMAVETPAYVNTSETTTAVMVAATVMVNNAFPSIAQTPFRVSLRS